MVHRHADFEHAQWAANPTRSDWPEVRARAVDAYKDRLHRMAGYIRALGAQPVFVTQRHGDWRIGKDGRLEGVVEESGAVNGLDHKILMDLYNRATLAVCREEKAICLDLASELELQPADFYDLVHNTPQGAAKIGHWMADKLKDTVKP
jgi:hypothetical protein